MVILKFLVILDFLVSLYDYVFGPSEIAIQDDREVPVASWALVIVKTIWDSVKLATGKNLYQVPGIAKQAKGSLIRPCA